MLFIFVVVDIQVATTDDSAAGVAGSDDDYDAVVGITVVFNKRVVVVNK